MIFFSFHFVFLFLYSWSTVRFYYVFITLSFAFCWPQIMTFFSVFIKRGGDADGRVLLEFLELIGSQNCKIPPTHELKKEIIRPQTQKCCPLAEIYTIRTSLSVNLSTDRSFSIKGHYIAKYSFRFREVDKRKKINLGWAP